MSVSSTPPPKRPHSPRLASAAFPRLPCEPRRALCEDDPNAETHDQNKKFLHCATFHSISSARRSSGSGKIRRKSSRKSPVRIASLARSPLLPLSLVGLLFPKLRHLQERGLVVVIHSFGNPSTIVCKGSICFCVSHLFLSVPSRGELTPNGTFGSSINIFVKCARAGTKYCRLHCRPGNAWGRAGL